MGLSNVGERGWRVGGSLSRIRHSSFDIFICCSTTVSSNSSRRVCPNTVSLDVSRGNSNPTLRSRPGPEERPTVRTLESNSNELIRVRKRDGVGSSYDHDGVAPFSEIAAEKRSILIDDVHGMCR